MSPPIAPGLRQRCRLRSQVRSLLIASVFASALMAKLSGHGADSQRPKIFIKASFTPEHHYERVRLPNFGAELREHDVVSIQDYNIRGFQDLRQIGQKKMIFDGSRGKRSYLLESDEDTVHKFSEDDNDRYETGGPDRWDMRKQPLRQREPDSEERFVAEQQKKKISIRERAQEIRDTYDEYSTLRSENDNKDQDDELGHWSQVNDPQKDAVGLDDVQEFEESQLRLKKIREAESTCTPELDGWQSPDSLLFRSFNLSGVQTRSYCRNAVLADIQRARKFVGGNAYYENSTAQKEEQQTDSTCCSENDEQRALESLKYPPRQMYRGPHPFEWENDKEPPKVVDDGVLDLINKRERARNNPLWNNLSHEFERIPDGVPLPFLTAPPTPAPDLSTKRTKQGRSKVFLKYQIRALEKRIESIFHAGNFANPAVMADVSHLKSKLQRYKFMYNDEDTSDIESKRPIPGLKKDTEVMHGNMVYEWSGNNMTMEKVTFQEGPQSTHSEEEQEQDPDILLKRRARFEVGDRIRLILRGYEPGTIKSRHLDGLDVFYWVLPDGDGAYRGQTHVKERFLAPLPKEEDPEAKVKANVKPIKRQRNIEFIAKPPPGLIQRPLSALQAGESVTREVPGRSLNTNGQSKFIENKITQEKYRMPRPLSSHEIRSNVPPPPQPGYRYVPPDKRPQKNVTEPTKKPPVFKAAAKSVTQVATEDRDFDEIPDHLREKFRRQYQHQKSAELRAKQNEAIEKRMRDAMRRPQFKYRLSKKRDWDKIKGPYQPKQK